MTRALEWVLGMLGAALCVAGTIVVWQYLHAFNSATPYARQEIWPFPGGYLVEMIVLGIVGLASVAFNKAPHSPRWGGVTWSVAGAVLGFAAVSHSESDLQRLFNTLRDEVEGILPGGILDWQEEVLA